MKTKKKSGKTLRKSGKSQGKIREFDGIKKWEPCNDMEILLAEFCSVQ